MLAQPSMEGRVPPPSSVRAGVPFSTTTGTEQARSMTNTIAFPGQQPPMHCFLKLFQQYFRKQTPI